MFFFKDTAISTNYTLSLHDALPICAGSSAPARSRGIRRCPCGSREPNRSPSGRPPDRKSTRLNSSHVAISYAVFCLKKKKENKCLSKLRSHVHNIFIDDAQVLTLDT